MLNTKTLTPVIQWSFPLKHNLWIKLLQIRSLPFTQPFAAADGSNSQLITFLPDHGKPVCSEFSKAFLAMNKGTKIAFSKFLSLVPSAWPTRPPSAESNGSSIALGGPRSECSCWRGKRRISSQWQYPGRWLWLLVLRCPADSAPCPVSSLTGTVAEAGAPSWARQE